MKNNYKFSIEEMVDYIIFKCNDYVGKVIRDVYPEFYDFSKMVCDKVNNNGYFRSFFKEPIYITSINFWDDVRSKYYDDDLVLVEGDDDLYSLYTYFKNPIKINLAKKWKNYQNGKYFPGMLVGVSLKCHYSDDICFGDITNFAFERDIKYDDVKVFSSIPKKIIMLEEGSELLIDKPSSAIPVSYFNKIRMPLLDTKLFDLYYNCIDNKNNEVLEIIEKKKEKIATIASSKIYLDNGVCVQIKLDPKKEFCRSNVDIKIYDNYVDNSFVSYKYDELNSIDKKVKKNFNCKSDSFLFQLQTIFDFELYDIDKKYNDRLKEEKEEEKILSERNKRLEQLESLKKEEKKVNMAIEEIKNKIVSNLEELKHLDNNITRIEILQDVLFYWNDSEKCFEVYEGFRDKLRFIDLSLIDFTNVKVSGLDFRGCNATFFDPQKVKGKDVRNCKFQLTNENGKKDNFYIPSSNWDFEGVNLSNTNLYVSSEYAENNALSMPKNIDKAIIDDYTVLPELLKTQLNIEDSDSKYNEFVQYLEDKNISLDEVEQFTKILKQQKNILVKKK